MSSGKQKTYLTTPGRFNDELKDFIQTYKSYLQERQAVLQQGEQIPEPDTKTKVIKEFEQLLSNPVQNLLIVQKKLDQGLVQIVDRFVSLFILKSKKTGLIKSAFRKVKNGHSLFYGIVLEEDNFENREKAFDFLTYYYNLQFSDKIPVYFQFMTEEIKKTFKKVKALS